MIISGREDIAMQSQEVALGTKTPRARKMVVIGGVAAGTKAAVKAKRENPDLDVTVLEAGEHVSYAGCGLPYFIGDVIKSESQLLVRKPQDFMQRNGVRVLTRHVATDIVPSEKKVLARDTETGLTKEFPYDVLVIATGANPLKPRLPGVDLDGIFTLRRLSDAVNIKRLVRDRKPKAAVVVGGGLIGLEAAENLKAAGLQVHVVELLNQVLPGFDEDLAKLVENHLAENGVRVITGHKVTTFVGDSAGRVVAAETDAGRLPADLVVLAIGVRPNVDLAKRAGVEVGPTGAIRVNRRMETNLPGIYAVGDCAENVNLVSRTAAWYPMGSTSNKTGRVAAINAAHADENGDAGDSDALDGVLGTTILKVFRLNVGRTGLTQCEARKMGFDPVAVTVPANDRAHYYPGHNMVITRLVADRQTHKVLGAQILGEGVVDKPLDIIVTAISLGARVEDLAKLDLAYAPPFSSAMSTTIVTANVMLNKLSGRFQGIDARQLKEALTSGKPPRLLDVRTEPEHQVAHIPGSINIPLDELKNRLHELDRDSETVVICKVGLRAYLASLVLRRAGFARVKVLEGGMTAYPYETV